MMLMRTTMVTMCIMYMCECYLLLASGATTRIGAADFPDERSANLRGGAHSKHIEHILQHGPLGLALALRQATAMGAEAGEADRRTWRW